MDASPRTTFRDRLNGQEETAVPINADGIEELQQMINDVMVTTPDHNLSDNVARPYVEFESQREVGLQFGDTIIHTSSPVYVNENSPRFHNQQSPSPNQQSSELQQKCEELKLLLKGKVESTANELSSLSDYSQRPIKPVSLSMVSKPHQIDDEFLEERECHRRHDLEIVCGQPQGDIIPEQLFARAKQRAQEEADKKFVGKNEKGKQEHIQKHGNVIGIVGQAGIGKTELTKQLALQALTELLVGKVSFFFYILVRFIDFKKQMNLLQFLLHTMLPDWQCPKNLLKHLLDVISMDVEVFLIFDGIDEEGLKFDKKVSIASLHSKNTADVFLKNLMSGKLLPHSRKLFTSRPAPFYKLHPSYRPTFVVQMHGLTPKSQDELGRQICGERYGQIQAKLSQNRNLFSYCYVPATFVLTLHYLMSYEGDIQFVSITRVLSHTCLEYSQTQNSENLGFVALAKLAWEGIREAKVIFNLNLLKTAKFEDSTAEVFLSTSVAKKHNLRLKILDGQKRVFFSHLIWQDFFAAIYLMLIMPLSEFGVRHTMLLVNRWEFVARFAFGICNPSVWEIMECLIPQFPKEVLKQKIASLRKLASTCVEQKILESQDSILLRACSWANEANDAKISSSVCSSFKGEVRLHHLILSPSEFESLSFVLQSYRSAQLRILDLSSSKIEYFGATCIASCIHACEEVCLASCQLQAESFKEISEHICLLKSPLNKLDLSNNGIGDRGALYVGNCIYNIEQVNLSGCDLTHVGAEVLSKKIAEHDKQIKKVDHSQNKLGDRGVASLGKCIQNVDELDLSKCKVGGLGINELSNGIKGAKMAMKKLSLSGNKLGDFGATFISRCIFNIKDLDLDGCGITCRGAEDISKAVEKLENPLKKLNLSNNRIEDIGGASISRSFKNTKKIGLAKCGITYQGLEEISKPISLLKTPMKEIDLSENLLRNESAECLTTWLPNVEKLTLAGCGFTLPGMNVLREKYPGKRVCFYK